MPLLDLCQWRSRPVSSSPVYRFCGVELTDPFCDELIEQRMRPQRGAQDELDVGMASIELVARGRQIPSQVNALRKEVRDHQDTSCAQFNTPAAARKQLGLGEFEKAGLDDRVSPLRRQSGCQLVQVVVGGRLAAAVGDQ